jgi:hypothetical protein
MSNAPKTVAANGKSSLYYGYEQRSLATADDNYSQ